MSQKWWKWLGDGIELRTLESSALVRGSYGVGAMKRRVTVRTRSQAKAMRTTKR